MIRDVSRGRSITFLGWAQVKFGDLRGQTWVAAGMVLIDAPPPGIP